MLVRGGRRGSLYPINNNNNIFIMSEISQQFYLKYKGVSSVMKWYLSSAPESLSVLEGGRGDSDLALTCLSDELRRVGQELGCLLRRTTRYSSVVLLLGAGGVVVYLLRRRRPSPPPSSRRRFRPRSLWSWLFEEELVEDFTRDSYLLRSHYFGPAPSQPASRPCLPYLLTDPNEPQEKNGGLNGLWAEDGPKKFLKRPLFDIRHRGQTRHLLEKVSMSSAAATPVHIANPCPRCVKGKCRLKKHQMYAHSSSSSSNYSGSPPNKPKTSTPDPEDAMCVGQQERLSGDGSDETDEMRLQDDLAKFSGTPVGFLKDQYRPSYRLYGPARGAPDGKERYSESPSLSSRCSSPSSDLRCPRSDSIDSDACSISGSMVDLVQNAREVRRLIRETSFDSTASDFSLDFSLNENLGASTADGLEGLSRGLSRLMDNCETIDQDMSFIPPAVMVTSKSTMSGLSQYSTTTTEGGEDEEGSLVREGSIPDLRDLQRTLRNNKGLWKLTNFSNLSDRSRQASIVSDSGSFEWDSPVHGWTGMKGPRVPLAYQSSSFSESGDEVGSLAGSLVDPWEWDDVYYLEDGEEHVERMTGHRSWLPDVGAELDLESELRLLELSSTTTSARSSLDREMFVRRRLPPSGRSSVTREARLSISSRGSSQSDDLTISASRPRSKSRSRSKDLTGCVLHRSASMDSNSERSWLDLPAETGVSMDTSVDTGISSMNSSMCSNTSSSVFVSSVNLSPVKEAGEPPTSPAHASPNSPLIVLGDISTTETVIKVNIPVTSEQKLAPRALFNVDADETNGS